MLLYLDCRIDLIKCTNFCIQLAYLMIKIIDSYTNNYSLTVHLNDSILRN